MNARVKSNEGSDGVRDRLESYGIYLLARQLFDEFWEDSELLARDFRGQELARQQVRSLNSVCANIEEGYGRGYGKELPQHLRISRGEARESKGRYQRCCRLLPSSVIQARTATLDRIIGGLTRTIVTIEKQRTVQDARPVSRHTPLVTRHAQ